LEMRRMDRTPHGHLILSLSKDEAPAASLPPQLPIVPPSFFV